MKKHVLMTMALAAWVSCSAESTFAALAQQAGGSGYSGTLSNNKAIRKQQLIADPNHPISGSTSLSYDPSVVTISSLIFGPGYGGTGFVEVDDGEGTFLQDIDSFLSSPAGSETGYAQVFYSLGGPIITFGASTPLGASLPTTPGQIPVAPGFIPIKKGGPTAVDTHAFEFTYLPTVPDSTVAVYTIFAKPPNSETEELGDFMEGEDGQGNRFILNASQIAPVTVRSNLNAVPLPPQVWAGLATLAAIVVVASRRHIASLMVRA